MRNDDLDDKARTRAEPLPEERAVQPDDDHRRSEAATILSESEDRVAAAAGADRPSDAAHEHRRSEDTAR